jgi:hypothetical protein
MNGQDLAQISAHNLFSAQTARNVRIGAEAADWSYMLPAAMSL